MSLSVDPKFNVSTLTSTANQFSNILTVFLFKFLADFHFLFPLWQLVKDCILFPPRNSCFWYFPAIFYQPVRFLVEKDLHLVSSSCVIYNDYWYLLVIQVFPHKPQTEGYSSDSVICWWYHIINKENSMIYFSVLSLSFPQKSLVFWFRVSPCDVSNVKL